MMKWAFLLVLLCFILPNGAAGETVKGIYGVPSIALRDPFSYVADLEKAGVNGVFVKPDLDTVKWFKNRGFKVFISVDAYGGKQAWKTFPNARPVLADGSLLGKDSKYACHGGACPTHEGWRKQRLAYIDGLFREYGAAGVAPDGIWLDYIRYPGRWSVREPSIPDTCYCVRCLKKFAADTGIQVPVGDRAEDVSRWIKKHCPSQWMDWKTKQVEGFVRDVRGVLDRYSAEVRPVLGIFLVPWTQGERGNAVCSAFGQDGFELAKYADVLSPMLYPGKVGQPPAWVGYMVQYYVETVPCEVWPIVQSMDFTFEEFADVMRYAGEGGGTGVLAYPFQAVFEKNLWDGFRGFERLPNLLRIGQSPRWDGGSEVGLCPGYGECREWVAPLEKCEPGAEYLFQGEFYQRVWENGAYPVVSIWGEEHLLNTHWKSKVFQPLRARVKCPDRVAEPAFRFINCNPDKAIFLRNPEVKRFYAFRPRPPIPVKKAFFDKGFFPIGVYGANLNNLEQIKRLAVNTVVLRGTGENLEEQVEKCHGVGLRYMLTTPREPGRLSGYLDEIARYVRPYDMAFYVNDEPGIHSFPTGMAEDVNRLLKDRFPMCATAMAVVRPQVCREYVDGADFFLLDQYPVPFMPFGWLSDSIDCCAGSLECTDYDPQITQITQKVRGGVGRGRLGAVIQAFGGPGRLDHPRMPTWREMDCLAFLSVVHGARAIFFYTYSWIGKTVEGRDRLGRVIGRLNRVYPWLVVENADEKVAVEMISENRFDPKGRPAVECCVKRKGGEKLLIAVNTIGTGVECLLSADYTDCTDKEKSFLKEVFSGEDYVIRDGKIRVKLVAYGVKVFRSTGYTDYTE